MHELFVPFEHIVNTGKPVSRNTARPSKKAIDKNQAILQKQPIGP